MEEKEIKKEIEQEGGAPQKLTYEQLEAYAAQTTEQAKKIFHENQMLKKALYENSLREIEVAVKCLNHADKFSPEFVKAITARIEELMNPNREEPSQEEKEG
jgi:hypothetical protein